MIRPVLINNMIAMNLYSDQQNSSQQTFDLKVMRFCQNGLHKRTLEFGSCQELFYTNQVYFVHCVEFISFS